jgi:hypothetical protein
MLLVANTCYRITYEDYSSVTFRIEGEVPLALHQIRIRNLHTGKEGYLFDLLIHNWIDFVQVN